VLFSFNCAGKDRQVAKKKDTPEKKPRKPARKPRAAAKRHPGHVDPPASAPEKESDIDPRASERGDVPMSLVDHLDEFRSRFVVSLLSILFITLAGFFFSEHLLHVINRPYLATGLKLNIFNLIDGFVLRLKASLVAGVLLAFPIIVYEIWKYIVPAIDKKERAFARAALVVAVFLFYLGVTLTYLALPMAVKALLSFTPPDITNTINASQYFSFVLIFCFAMGLIFELPIVILILTKIGIVTPSFLISKRKWAIVLIWILAAVITPTVDPLTQSLVAVPLMLLYEISILISRLVVMRKKKREMMEG
jgi:sec-independent protein translocase protein TatC